MIDFLIDFKETQFLETSQVLATPTRLNWRAELLLTRNRELIEGKRILDLASHDGRFSYACLKLNAKHVTGIEGRPLLVENAVENFNKLGFDSTSFSFIVGDIFDHLAKFDPESFDTILCFGFFYHTTRQTELLSEIRRLKPKALILDTKVKRIPRILKIAQKLQKLGLLNITNKGTPKLAGAESPLQELLAEKYTVYRYENSNADANTIDPLSLVALPTDQMVRFFLKTYGFSFQKIDWLKAEIQDWTELIDYKIDQRFSYVCHLNQAI